MNLRQVLLGKVDQALHSRRRVDSAAVFAQLCWDILGVPATPGQGSTLVAIATGACPANLSAFRWRDLCTFFFSDEN
ncbi:Thimet oligopeptidase [Liparis tanakae]|uniref:Thimet oligopeptidase n=1 Tax=Liparis tanakae TaxID=230148 RepID=A0A4Z2E9R0_9TELE|nr:Thimet oligopeptidase [Liparis tanakae]